MTSLCTRLAQVLKDVVIFSQAASGIKLRAYQEQVARAVVDSVIHKRGLTFVVIFPRQSGKNELQAQIETYLLTLYAYREAEIVKVSPTWKPQSFNAMRRLERILKRNILTRSRWCKEQGYIYRLDNARIFFLSGSDTSNVVGATASTLLECDEAQDVAIAKWDKELAPMAASTNATRVFWGTAWTSQTLLAREKRAALEEEKKDGVRRVFEIDCDVVSKEVPAYANYVLAEIAKHGRNHPFVRTQYFSEEIDESVGMFTADRLALMQGAHPPYFYPLPDHLYAFTIDVGGEEFNDENGNLNAAGQRDSTALTIFEVDPSCIDLEIELGPLFNVVYRKTWTGISQLKVYKQIHALVELWNPHRVVVDATGVGEGLASFLLNFYGKRLIPFKFTQASKSNLGWRLLSMIESGRIKEYCVPCSDKPLRDQAYEELSQENLAQLQHLLFEQARRCSFEILPGPGQLVKWGVPASARSFETGEPLHDDLVLSLALVAELTGEPWGSAESAVIPAPDPLEGMKF